MAGRSLSKAAGRRGGAIALATGLALSGAWLVAPGAGAAVSENDGPDAVAARPAKFHGTIKCNEVDSGWSEIKLEGGDLTDGTYPASGPVQIEVDFTTADGQTFGFRVATGASTIGGVDAVIVKAGDDETTSSIYRYTPEEVEDDGLTRPAQNGISHISFCYDSGGTTSEPTGTTGTTTTGGTETTGTTGDTTTGATTAGATTSGTSTGETTSGTTGSTSTGTDTTGTTGGGTDGSSTTTTGETGGGSTASGGFSAPDQSGGQASPVSGTRTNPTPAPIPEPAPTAAPAQPAPEQPRPVDLFNIAPEQVGLPAVEPQIESAAPVVEATPAETQTDVRGVTVRRAPAVQAAPRATLPATGAPTTWMLYTGVSLVLLGYAALLWGRRPEGAHYRAT